MTAEQNEERMRALLLNKQIHLQVRRVLDNGMTYNGLTATQGHILMFIIDKGGKEVYSTDIHKEFGISRATVSGLIKKLRSGGYVEYQGCEDDERHKIIAVTPKALALKKSLDENMELFVQKFFCEFTDEEMTQLNKAQKKLIKNIEVISKEEKL